MKSTSGPSEKNRSMSIQASLQLQIPGSRELPGTSTLMAEPARDPPGPRDPGARSEGAESASMCWRPTPIRWGPDYVYVPLRVPAWTVQLRVRLEYGGTSNRLELDPRDHDPGNPLGVVERRRAARKPSWPR